MSLFHDADFARRLGLVLAAASAVAAVLGLTLFVTAGGQLADSWMPHNAMASLTMTVAFAAMVNQQPKNAAVWTLGWSLATSAFGQVLAMGVAAAGVGRTLGTAAVRGEVAYTYGDLPGWLAWTIASVEVTWVLVIFPIVTLALLLFPDGRLPSRRWRVVVGMALVGMGLVLVGLTVAGTPRSDLAPGAYLATPILNLTVSVGVLLLFAAILATIASLIVRYRAAVGDQRRQIRWIAVGGGLVGLTMCSWAVLFTFMFIDAELAERIVWVGLLVSLPVLLAAYAVAILRYRLYDIDVVISRSLVIAALAGFIALVYVAVVVGMGTLVGAGEANLGLQVVATAIVAVAFQPLRRRVRRWADRLVYGQRATPYEVLAGFSRHAANPGDEANLQRIAQVLAAGTGAQPATVWLRVGDQLQPAASSDAVEATAPVVMALRDGDLPELPVSLVVPVAHDGELLGAVTLTKPRSEPPTSQDQELTTRLARGLALVLRNARLTAELRAHLEALQASRSRLVRAQDEARRRIEGELRQGAQRQLAELKDLIEQAREHSVGSGAVRTATLLEQLETEAEDAIDTLRSLAQGIYPPVLAAEGLGAAIAEQTRKSTLPVTAHTAGLPRYPAEIEAAVYFCVLEALQNAAKYAQATSVHVRLESHGDQLRFEVSDDGIGFDPQATSHGSGLKGITARLDTIGGVLNVTSRPGAGTRILGRIPTPPPHTPAPAHVSAPRVATEVPA